jgi:hypothetical protein
MNNQMINIKVYETGKLYKPKHPISFYSVLDFMPYHLNTNHILVYLGDDAFLFNDQKVYLPKQLELEEII